MRERIRLRPAHAAAGPAAGHADVFAAYDAVACGMIVRDGAGAVVYANEAARRMLGLRLDEVRAPRCSSTSRGWAATSAWGTSSGGR